MEKQMWKVQENGRKTSDATSRGRMWAKPSLGGLEGGEGACPLSPGWSWRNSLKGVRMKKVGHGLCCCCCVRFVNKVGSEAITRESLRRQDEEVCQTQLERLINSAQGSAGGQSTGFCQSLSALRRMPQQAQRSASEKAADGTDHGCGFARSW